MASSFTMPCASGTYKQPAPGFPGAPASRGSFESHLRRAGVGRQPFAFGEDRGKLSEPGRRGLRHADDAGALLEIVDAERRGEARAAGSGQNVVRPRAIVADRL